MVEDHEQLEQEEQQQEGEGLEALEKEAKQPVAVPDEQEDGCTIEQQVDHAEWVVCLCLYLYHAVGGEEVLPAAVPNEEEDDDTEEQVEEQEKGHCCSHLANEHEN